MTETNAFVTAPRVEKEVMQLEQLLRALYYQADAPTAEELLDYELGLLAPVAAARVAAYIQHSPALQQDLADLQALATVPHQAASQVDGLTRLLRWLRARLPDRPLVLALPQLPSLTPAMALRGAQTGETALVQRFVYHAGVYRLSLTLTPSAMTQSGALLEGQAINQQQIDEVCTGQAQLLQSEQAVGETRLDTYGIFTLPEIPPGKYALVVALPTHTLWVQELTIP